MNGLEITEYSGEGYKPMIHFNNWRVAILRDAPRFRPSKEVRLERHMLTDEVFVLLTGKATLLMGETGEEVPMEPCKLYNVKQEAWHHIWVSPEASVLIVENDDTGLDNSEYLYITKESVQ